MLIDVKDVIRFVMHSPETKRVFQWAIKIVIIANNLAGSQIMKIRFKYLSTFYQYILYFNLLINIDFNYLLSEGMYTFIYPYFSMLIRWHIWKALLIATRLFEVTFFSSFSFYSKKSRYMSKVKQLCRQGRLVGLHGNDVEDAKTNQSSGLLLWASLRCTIHANSSFACDSAYLLESSESPQRHWAFSSPSCFSDLYRAQVKMRILLTNSSLSKVFPLRLHIVFGTIYNEFQRLPDTFRPLFYLVSRFSS